MEKKRCSKCGKRIYSFSLCSTCFNQQRQAHRAAGDVWDAEAREWVRMAGTREVIEVSPLTPPPAEP